MKRLLCTLLFVLACGFQALANSSLSIGQSAPDFNLPDLRGQSHTLKEQRGKITVIAFLSVQCPISNAYNERIRALAEDYAKQGVAFLAINSSAPESIADIKAHALQHNFAFPILKDTGNKVADAYGAERTPEIFVVDAQGVLRYHGRIDNSQDLRRVKRNDLREALNELLAGKPVSVSEAKAMGCVIKRVQAATTRYGTESDSDRVDLRSQRTWPTVNPYTFSFAPQKAKPAVKRPATTAKPKPATTAAASKPVLLKPAEFPKLRDSFKGQVLVINFWATWCAPCVAEMPEFVKLDAEYRNKGVRVIAISADDTTDLNTLVARFVREKKLVFPIYVQDTDDPQEMIDMINKDWPGTLPATFVYDKQGQLVLSRFGIIDREQLMTTVENALK
jgi:peroxiredoxin